MLIGMHSIVYTSDAEATRAFFRDVLGFASVDAGHGWLIFALPPGEIGFHPTGEGDEGDESEEGKSEDSADARAGPPAGKHELYFMCDDVKKTMAELAAKGVKFTTPPMDRGWGILTGMQVPGAGTMYLYQPKHPLAIGKK